MKGVRLESLDISLNTWSLIVFFSQVMMMLSIFIMIANTTIGSFILMTSFWLISQFTFLFYGIFTDQIGFVFLFVFNVILTIIGIFVKLDNVEGWEENE